MGVPKAMENLLFVEDGKFHSFIKKSQKSIDLKAFESLPSIEDKIIFLTKNGIEYKPVEKTISPDLEKALKYKEEGNKCFKAGKGQEAKDWYTKSLQWCPFDKDNLENNKEYSIILANRSAVLDQNACYEAALRDIDLALKCGYPKELKFKIYNRQGHALFQRKQFIASKAAFQKCSDFIGKSEMQTQERERWRLKMAKQKSVFNSAKKGLADNIMPPRPWTQAAENAENETKLDLDENSKSLKLIKNANVEEILYSEKPLASVVLEGGKAEGKVCPHSLKRMAAGVPCNMGSTALFASGDARQEASESYHKYEYKTIDAWKDSDLTEYARLAYRIFASKHDEIDAILALPSPKTESFAMICVLKFMLDNLELHGYFDANDEKLGKNDALKKMLKIICVTCKYAIRVFLGDPPASEKELLDLRKFPVSEYALGIYPQFAKFRYMTTPSTGGSDIITFFQDGKLFLQSVRQLKSGQTVDIFSENMAKTEECLNDMISFKCANGEKCDLSFPLKEKTNEKIIKCPACGVETNIWKHLKRIVELKKDHETAKKEITERKEIRSGLNFLADLIAEWDTFVYRPYIEITKLEENLKKAIQLNNELMEREWMHSNR